MDKILFKKSKWKFFTQHYVAERKKSCLIYPLIIPMYVLKN